MNLISRSKLNDFATKHPDAEKPLDAWFKVASHALWRTFVDVRHTFPSADLVGRLTVFNIGGNNYRLIAKITYGVGTTGGTAYIRSVLTHADYDEGDWKHDAWF